MLNRRSLLAISILLSLAALALLWSGRLSVFYLRQEVTDGLVVEARGDRAVEQSFLSHYPGISEVAVRLVDPAPPDDQLVLLRLRAASAGAPDLLVAGGSVAELRQGNWLRFHLPELDSAIGGIYVLRVETQGSAPLRLQAHSQNLYPEGYLADGGDLVFQVHYSGRVLDTSAAFLARVIEHKPGPFGQVWFYVLLLAGYGITAIAALAVSVRSREHAEPPGADAVSVIADPAGKAAG